MIVDLNLVKLYLKLEPDYIYEDELLNLMNSNAEQYLIDAGIDISLLTPEQLQKAKLICLILVTDFYENREMTGKTSEKVRFVVQSMIMQLKYGGDTV